jgi:hypothetical protein
MPRVGGTTPVVASAGSGWGSSADRDGDGDVGLDDRVENTVDSAIGHDDPHRSNVGDGRDDNADRG